ncbi:potassium channel family protein [Peptostreptococcus equinus]|uniref:TrkA family potassium uptake protein n=1 Tax=Peptostreptococcus equinus TaxID=3003601 RepID=A0ABY7JRN0_9FIRM|nr:TrkA family potassium uptake protein [Peptostreptococcus sp. CBA3647]WAW15501.1 TrkA family potassium uptake protein [Peptostreptococcus sp. CBA3647]
MKQYMIIGAGRFGKSVAETLINMGQEVMLIDGNEDVIQQISEDIENVAIVDVTDEHALKNVGLGNFDVAIVAIGTDLRASIMATLIAKELGVPLVVSKAKDKLQAEVLKRIGADKVVFPEVDMGEKIAKSLMFDNVVDYMKLDEEHSIFEVTVPTDWIGKNLIDLSARKKYNINIVGVKSGCDELGKFEVPADPNRKFTDGDIIVIAGKSKVIEEIALLVSEEEWKR